MPPSPVSVVIATRNRGPVLLGTLARLRALPERPPVVVVDNGSADGTAELVRAHHPGVRVVGLRRIQGAARTVGARLVDSPISPSATTTPGGPRAPSAGPSTCLARRCSASSPAGRWCGGRRSFRSAGSTLGWGSGGRRSWPRSTWLPAAGAWPMWTRWSPTTTPHQAATPRAAAGSRSATPSGRPGPAPAGGDLRPAPGHAGPALGAARAPPVPEELEAALRTLAD